MIGALAVAWVAVAVLGAALVRARRQHRRALEERGWLLEKESETAARQAVDAERSRIARELHDIVSHNVSVMVVQAGAAREVLTSMPVEAGTALQAVEGAGRDALTELRRLLGLLAPSADGQDEEDDLMPQPGLSRLGQLVDRIAFAGLPVEVRISGEQCPLPAGIDLTAYRIVQEALTNALKHGQTAHGVRGTAEVTIRYTDHYLRIEVVNSGPSVLSGDSLPPPEADTPGGGRGLLGLQERVAAYGGDLVARRRLGGGYRVRARIPLDRP